MRTWVAVLVLSLAGCGSIDQMVKPVVFSGDAPREICVVENTKVRAGFLEAYTAALSGKGFTTRMLPPGSPATACPLTTTYTANWRWDLALYLAYANVRVFQDGQLGGEALYDSKGAGASTSKFINATEKIRELTDQLFPR